MSSYTFTSESVSEGHPDKVCDFIADSILDAHLAGDPNSRVACEVLCKSGEVILAGEITSHETVDYEQIARGAIREIGYVDPSEAFNADGVRVTQFISKQSGDIAMGVDTGGAGDQGIMFGYATDETPELMPLPVQLAHRLSQRLATARKKGERAWLRPDSKTQVSVRYEDNRPVRVETVLVSTQHTKDAAHEEIRDYVASCSLPEVLGAVVRPARRDPRQPHGTVHRRRPVGRLRRHRPQDHRRFVRRDGAPRRRRVQREGPVEGRPQRRVLRPLRRAPGRAQQACASAPKCRSPTRSAARSRYRCESIRSEPATSPRPRSSCDSSTIARRR